MLKNIKLKASPFLVSGIFPGLYAYFLLFPSKINGAMVFAHSVFALMAVHDLYLFHKHGKPRFPNEEIAKSFIKNSLFFVALVLTHLYFS